LSNKFAIQPIQSWNSLQYLWDSIWFVLTILLMWIARWHIRINLKLIGLQCCDFKVGYENGFDDIEKGLDWIYKNIFYG